MSIPLLGSIIYCATGSKILLPGGEAGNTSCENEDDSQHRSHTITSGSDAGGNYKLEEWRDHSNYFGCKKYDRD